VTQAKAALRPLVCKAAASTRKPQRSEVSTARPKSAVLRCSDGTLPVASRPIRTSRMMADMRTQLPRVPTTRLNGSRYAGGCCAAGGLAPTARVAFAGYAARVKTGLRYGYYSLDKEDFGDEGLTRCLAGTRCLRFTAGVAPAPRKNRFRLLTSHVRSGLPRATPLNGLKRSNHQSITSNLSPAQ